MSTLKVSNIQKADATVVGIALNTDGSVTIPSLDADLASLSDLDLASPQVGDLLAFNGNDWANEGADGVVDPRADARIAAASVGDLSDVDTPSPDAGQTLVWDGAAWGPGTVASDLDGLNDVIISQPSAGQALVYDDTTAEWVNDTFPAVGLRTADVVVEVGPGGDFDTINEALRFLSTLRTEHADGTQPNSGLIRLVDGFTMAEQVLVDGHDYSWVTILSDAGSDPVAISTFEQGTLVPGFSRPEVSEVQVAPIGSGDLLDDQYVIADNAAGDLFYFWFQVLRFAEVTVQDRVRVVSVAPGLSDLAVVTAAAPQPGDALAVSLVGDNIEVQLGTRAADTQATGLVFSEDDGTVRIDADAGGPFDGADGNLAVEIIDSGSSGISASVAGGTLTVDLGGTSSASTAVFSAALSDVAGLTATVEESGNFTIADDLGVKDPLSGGFDAGTIEPSQNTSALVAAEIDALAEVTASAVAGGSITVEDEYPFAGGAGESADPTAAGAVSVEVEIDVSFDGEQAAGELRNSVDAQTSLTVDATATGLNVRWQNDADGVADDTLAVGNQLTAITTQRGEDDGFQTLANAAGHSFVDGDRITIRNHEGTIEERDYNGRWTVANSDAGAGTFELSYVADPRALFSSDRAGEPDTAEAVLPEDVPVSRAALTEVWEFFYRPAFGVARGVLPTIGCVFAMDETGPNPYGSYRDGLCATDQGRINLLPFAGFVNAGGSNIYATRSSIINANDAVADGAKRHGVWAYSNSIINARRVSATGCGADGVGEDVGGGFDAAGVPVGSGVVSERGALVNAEGMDAADSTSSAFIALYGGQINVGGDPGLAQGEGSSTLGEQYQVRSGVIYGVGPDSLGWVTPDAGVTERLVVDDDTTLVADDGENVVAIDSADPHIVTVPLDSTEPVPVGAVIGVYRAGAGAVDIVAESGVTVRNIGAISETFGEVSLRKRGTNEWVLVGEVDEA